MTICEGGTDPLFAGWRVRFFLLGVRACDFMCATCAHVYAHVHGVCVAVGDGGA